MKEIKTSPIFYQGCKKKLIKKGLIDLFPKNIKTFYDLFGGSGIVAMNVQANNYVLNDLNSNLFELYKLFKNSSADSIIEHINNRVKEFELATIRTKRNKFFDLDVIEQQKQAYINFREFYNCNKNTLDLYTLIIFAFSQQMRFNVKTNNFNMPCGNDCFSDKNAEYIKQGCEFFVKDNVRIYNCSFRVCTNVCMCNTNDFIYLDPPYFDTTATYNENSAWTIEKEKQLQYYCEVLNKNHIKWGMSNSFASKGKVNQQLIDWCNKNNWNITHFDVKYSSMGKGNANNDEVYICNYEVQQ